MQINLIHNGFSIPHDLDLDDVLSTWIEHDKGRDIYIVAFYGGSKYEVDINTYYDIQRYLNEERGDESTGAF
jgi:hypothetical protein